MTKTIEVFRRRERERRKLKMRWSFMDKTRKRKVKLCMICKIEQKGRTTWSGEMKPKHRICHHLVFIFNLKGEDSYKEYKRCHKDSYLCLVLFCFVSCTIFLYCALHILFLLPGIPFLLFSHETPIQPFWRSSNNNPRRVWEFPENISVKW